MTKTSDTIKAHYLIVLHLIKQLVTQRYKDMAKDKVLFKFISSRIEPALLVDSSRQAEKEAR